jgi:hypothetical protein
MTPPLLPLTILAGLVALCGAMALAATAHEALSWEEAEQLLTALASTLEVAFDRILDGDLRGALRALAAL